MSNQKVISFIKKTALTQFNRQYGRKLKTEDFEVFSVKPCYSNSHGYEIYSVNGLDKLRLRLYFNIGQRTDFWPYRLENGMNAIHGALGDEVYVMIGFVDGSYARYEGLRFTWIDNPAFNLGILLQETGDPILLENGGYLLL